MSTRKINAAFATVWFVSWSRKAMRFLFKKAFQKDPSRGSANTTATDCKQAGRPKRWGRGHGRQPLGLWRPSCSAQPPLALHSHTDSFQHPLGSRRTEEFIFTCQRAPSRRVGVGGVGPAKRPVYGPRGTRGDGACGAGSTDKGKLRGKSYAPGSPKPEVKRAGPTGR